MATRRPRGTHPVGRGLERCQHPEDPPGPEPGDRRSNATAPRASRRFGSRRYRRRSRAGRRRSRWARRAPSLSHRPVATLGTGDGAPSYEIDLVSGSDVDEVSVDARTGEVVSTTEERVPGFVSGLVREDRPRGACSRRRSPASSRSRARGSRKSRAMRRTADGSTRSRSWTKPASLRSLSICGDGPDRNGRRLTRQRAGAAGRGGGDGTHARAQRGARPA